MFKKKAFFISLALLASNFLLPNKVRSGLEIGEQITSETQEIKFNFKISRYGNGYIGQIISDDFYGNNFTCSGETLAELSFECVRRVEETNFAVLPTISQLISTLTEEEEDIEEVVEVEEEVEEVEVETTEAEDIDFDSITVESLPYSVDCPPKNKDLKIKQNKKEKFVVRFASGKRFYRGLDFDEALEVFEETYEDKCVE